MTSNKLINSEGTIQLKPRIPKEGAVNINHNNFLNFGYRLLNSLVSVELTLQYFVNYNLLYKHFV